MEFTARMEDVARLLEITGVAILIGGGVWAAVWAGRDLLARGPVYGAVRRRFGRSLLLALEVLVAADIVQTVAVELTLANVLTLGLLVLVRTVLSLSLAVEIEGVVPWRRAELRDAGADEPA